MFSGGTERDQWHEMSQNFSKTLRTLKTFKKLSKLPEQGLLICFKAALASVQHFLSLCTPTDM